MSKTLKAFTMPVNAFSGYHILAATAMYGYSGVGGSGAVRGGGGTFLLTRLGLL